MIEQIIARGDTTEHPPDARLALVQQRGPQRDVLQGWSHAVMVASPTTAAIPGGHLADRQATPRSHGPRFPETPNGDSGDGPRGKHSCSNTCRAHRERERGEALPR